MGHSAGGHLALLYAYSTADNYSNPNDNPIKLVISEAGPTNFVESNGDIVVNNGDIISVAGITFKSNGEYTLTEKNVLKQASPYWWAYEASDKSILPYTILVYGDGLSAMYNNYGDENQNGLLDDGDTLIPYSQSTAILTALGESKCSRFELWKVGHTEFGEGSSKSVYPNVVIEENDDTEVQALKTLIQDYYNTISNTLQELAQQED